MTLLSLRTCLIFLRHELLHDLSCLPHHMLLLLPPHAACRAHFHSGRCCRVIITSQMWHSLRLRASFAMPHKFVIKRTSKGCRALSRRSQSSQRIRPCPVERRVVGAAVCRDMLVLVSLHINYTIAWRSRNPLPNTFAMQPVSLSASIVVSLCVCTFHNVLHCAGVIYCPFCRPFAFPTQTCVLFACPPGCGGSFWEVFTVILLLFLLEPLPEKSINPFLDPCPAEFLQDSFPHPVHAQHFRPVCSICLPHFSNL